MAVLPPVPLPRYARPGGYSVTAAATNPYAPRPGLLGQLLGIGNDPTYAALRPLLNDVGQGLATGNSWSSGIAGAASAIGRNAPIRAEQAMMASQYDDQMKQRDSAARNILAMSPDYKDLADAVSNGTIAPKDAFNAAFQRTSEQKKLAAEMARNEKYAQFVTDPTLKQLVALGAIDGAEAYKIEHPTSSSGDWGTTIVPGMDANNNMVPMRANPSGGLSVAQMPEGIRYAPVELQGAKTTATLDAKAQGAAQAALPGLEQSVEIANKALDLVTTDEKGLNEQFGTILGMPQRNLPVYPGSSLGNWQANFAQAKGQAFMQARQALKGGGQITDFEGAKAEAAYSRMESAAALGDKGTFLAAARDFRDAVNQGLEKLRSVARGDYSSSGPALDGTDYKTRYGLE